MLRAAVPILFLLMLSACEREPDFDERYDTANKKIRSMASEIDAQISATPAPDVEEGVAKEATD